ncbi:hypothetical protein CAUPRSCDRAFT_11157 [Caulochytrium protostelioides]|nr:hypothetical protein CAUPRSCDRAFT_11157 [Caulochytrium protostelioides]
MASNHGKAPDVDALHASAVASTLSRSPSTTAPPRTGVVVRAPTAGAGSVAPSSGRPSVVMNAGPRRSVVARIRESRAEAAAELTRMQHVREEEARVAQVAEMALLEARYTEYLRLIAVQFDEEAEHDTMMTARLDAVCAQAYQKALQRFDGDAGAAFRSRVRCNPVAGAQPRLAILDRLNSDLLRAHDHPGDR